MVFVDISLTPSLLGATLPLSLSLNKRVLDDFMGLCFFALCAFLPSVSARARHADLRIKTWPDFQCVYFRPQQRAVRAVVADGTSAF